MRSTAAQPIIAAVDAATINAVRRDRLLRYQPMSTSSATSFVSTATTAHTSARR